MRLPCKNDQTIKIGCYMLKDAYIYDLHMTHVLDRLTSGYSHWILASLYPESLSPRILHVILDLVFVSLFHSLYSVK